MRYLFYSFIILFLGIVIESCRSKQEEPTPEPQKTPIVPWQSFVMPNPSFAYFNRFYVDTQNQEMKILGSHHIFNMNNQNQITFTQQFSDDGIYWDNNKTLDKDFFGYYKYTPEGLVLRLHLNSNPNIFKDIKGTDFGVGYEINWQVSYSKSIFYVMGNKIIFPLEKCRHDDSPTCRTQYWGYLNILNQTSNLELSFDKVIEFPNTNRDGHIWQVFFPDNVDNHYITNRYENGNYVGPNVYEVNGQSSQFLMNATLKAYGKIADTTYVIGIGRVYNGDPQTTLCFAFKNQNWQGRIFPVSSIMNDVYFRFINQKMIIFYNRQIYQMKYDWTKNQIDIIELETLGLSNASIYEMAEFNERVYINTSIGIFYKSTKDFFTPKQK